MDDGRGGGRGGREWRANNEQRELNHLNIRVEHN